MSWPRRTIAVAKQLHSALSHLPSRHGDRIAESVRLQAFTVHMFVVIQQCRLQLLRSHDGDAQQQFTFSLLSIYGIQHAYQVSLPQLSSPNIIMPRELCSLGRVPLLSVRQASPMCTPSVHATGLK